MDGIAVLNPEERKALFSETAAKRGMTSVVVEKDFWVTWSLGKLFGEARLSRLLMFKGGTSLSKVFNLIERFSEDIDLILDWRVLTEEDPEGERSNTKQKKLNVEINEKAQKYIKEELAYRCGVHRTYMGAIERGERNISLLNILRISKALKIKSSEILSKAGL